MMKLFAKQPCSFNGRKFIIGEEIPTEYVLDPKAQERMGVLAIADDTQGSAATTFVQPMDGAVTFSIPIHTEEGDIALNVTNEELTVFTDILQVGAVKTEDKQKISDMIQKIESEDLLIMLSALDGRKFVKDTAEERAKALNLVGGDE